MDSLEEVREKLRQRLDELKPPKVSSEPENSGPKDAHTLLIVEDEALNLEALVNTFKDEFHVLSFNNGVSALEYLKANAPPLDIVLTDQRMPKMSGIQLLEEINKLYPHVIKLVLTAYTETRDLIDAINKGEVYRYITKPVDSSVLKTQLKQAMEKYKIEKEKRQMVLVLMEKNQSLEKHQSQLKHANLDTLRILGTIVQLKDPLRGRHALFVAQAAEFMAAKLSLPQDEVLNIIQAAHLHDIGKMGLPDWVVAGAGATTAAAENYYRQHPILGEAILLVSDYLRELAPLVRHHHERWNGTGFPDRLQQEKIPLGSRIIAVADEYDEYLTHLEQSNRDNARDLSEKAMAYINERKGTWLDPNLIPLFKEFLNSQATEVKEKFLTLSQLEEGMVVSRDVLTERGFVIIPKGTSLGTELIEKVKGFSSYIEIRDPVAIYA